VTNNTNITIGQLSGTGGQVKLFTDGAERVTVKGDKVGINTNDPQSSLDIVGDTLSSGNYTVNISGEHSHYIYRTDAGVVNNVVGSIAHHAKNSAGTQITQSKIIVQQQTVTAGQEGSNVYYQGRRGGTGSSRDYLVWRGWDGGVGINGDRLIVRENGTLFLGRSDDISEGAQIGLARASDNAEVWQIDVYGTGTATNLRFIDSAAGASRVEILSNGRLLAKQGVQFNDGTHQTTAFLDEFRGNLRGVKVVSSSTTLTTADTGKLILVGGGGVVNATLPNSNPLPVGSVLHLVSSNSSTTITASASIIYVGSTAYSGSITILPTETCTLVLESLVGSNATYRVISGSTLARYIAAQSYAIGSFIMMKNTSMGTYNYGDVYTPSAIYPSNSDNTVTTGVTNTGSFQFQCLGYSPPNTSTLWVRIA
jgi:hypothetical protein